ncbi:MAG: antibiotic biosynthesis monooxygenase [Deltaproteobacteria bacterium]|nr:antibiotic biosynthesis monooxygenase [Deltaproteobacteria bacterium]
MTRVLIVRKLKNREDIPKLIRQIKVVAMTQPGYISSEASVNADDPCAVSVISTWKNAASWKKWEKSKQRLALCREITPLLAEPEIITVYKILSNEELEYLADPEGWLRLKERHSLGG